MVGSSSQRFVATTAIVLALVAVPVDAASSVSHVTERTKLTATDGATGDFFGWAVAVDGDTAVVGARFDDDAGSLSGGAYIFERSRGGWVESAKLVGSDLDEGDIFGSAVAISGDTVVVGAVKNIVPAESGAVYVFTRTRRGWVETARLEASDAMVVDAFGASVAVSDDTIVVGAWGDDGVCCASGAAYVFTRTRHGWSEMAKLTASDADGGDFFGVNVGISGDTIVVTAQWDDDVGTSSGSAYVFEAEPTGWVETAKLTASDAAEDGRFGWSIGISGDTVVVGSPGDDDAGDFSGAAYVFAREPSGWVQTAKLQPADGAEGDEFGRSIDISGRRIAVGGTLNDDAGSNSGSAYLFEAAPGGWSETAKMTASDAAADDQFGWSIGISGDVVLVGAPFDDDAGAQAGSAYVLTP